MMKLRTTLPLAVSLLLPATLAAQTPGKIAEAVEASHGPTKTVVTLAVEAGQFQTLVAAVKAAGLVETLSGKGPFTIFAPTDEAFAKLGKATIADLLKPENKGKLTAILTYHVAGANLPAGKVLGSNRVTTLQGQSLAVEVMRGDDPARKVTGVKVGGANVTKTDIMGSNGVIHVIDTVLIPAGNIVEVASKAGSFTTLLTAAKAAGLAETLATGGPFTVFAPTDDAFAALGKDTIASLLLPENKAKLAGILKLHVVAGKVMAAQAVKLDSADTLAGEALSLQVEDGKLLVGGATVVSADVEASNGVIHVIDAVILPKQ